jgi:hypothetical protein
MNDIKHVDLFVLDVEGHEEQVIEGMKGCNILPDVFCIEDGLRENIVKNLTELCFVFDVQFNCNAIYRKR